MNSTNSSNIQGFRTIPASSVHTKTICSSSVSMSGINRVPVLPTDSKTARLANVHTRADIKMSAGTNVTNDSKTSFTPTGYLGLGAKSQLTRMNHGRVSNIKMLQTASSGAPSISYNVPTIKHMRPRVSNVMMKATVAEKSPVRQPFKMKEFTDVLEEGGIEYENGYFDQEFAESNAIYCNDVGCWIENIDNVYDEMAVDEEISDWNKAIYTEDFTKTIVEEATKDEKNTAEFVSDKLIVLEDGYSFVESSVVRQSKEDGLKK